MSEEWSNEWEKIGTYNDEGRTYRLKVPGGWLICVYSRDYAYNVTKAESVCFVPDPQRSAGVTAEEIAVLRARVAALEAAHRAGA